MLEVAVVVGAGLEVVDGVTAGVEIVVGAGLEEVVPVGGVGFSVVVDEAVSTWALVTEGRTTRQETAHRAINVAAFENFMME